jgi:hypothetical protein
MRAIAEVTYYQSLQKETLQRKLMTSDLSFVVPQNTLVQISHTIFYHNRYEYFFLNIIHLTVSHSTTQVL